MICGKEQSLETFNERVIWTIFWVGISDDFRTCIMCDTYGKKGWTELRKYFRNIYCICRSDPSYSVLVSLRRTHR